MIFGPRWEGRGGLRCAVTLSLSLRAARAHETDPSLSHRGVFPVRAEQQQQQPSVELRVIRQAEQQWDCAGN